jgi:hypothetical protein
MGKYRDSNLGSQAIHYASTTGCIEVIEILIKEYKADFHETTLGK